MVIEAVAETPPRSEFWHGVRATLPLILGAIPFGIIFGAAAAGSGLTTAATIGMSLLVFAGSAQFIAANLVKGGAPLLVIILTTFVVNLRHMLYSATLAPHVKRLPQQWLLPLGFWLTDETFAVTSTRYNEPDASPYKHWFYFGSALSMYANWQLCTWIGLIAGGVLPDTGRLGLDFAMIATFIGIVVPSVRTRPMLIAVVVAGIASLLTFSLPNKLGLIIAALAGVAAGAIAESMNQNQRTTAVPEESS